MAEIWDSCRNRHSIRRAWVAQGNPGIEAGRTFAHHSDAGRLPNLKVISKEPSGQRELTDPRVQQSIRETLLNRKDQLLKAAYYEVARNEAQVQNYLARGVIDNAGKTAK
jgi:hypothetical protein